MHNNNELCRTLENLWHKEIPLSQAMALSVVSFEKNSLETKAQFLPNRNVMGTAFAGSLYSVQALTGWGMLWLQLQLAGIDDADIVLASGDIQYLKPLSSDLVTRCHFADVVEIKGSLSGLKQLGKVRLKVSCSVIDTSSDDGQTEIVSRFVGDYVIKITSNTSQDLV